MLRVGSREQVERILERLREKWEEEDVEAEVRTRMEGKIRFEMVGKREEVGGEVSRRMRVLLLGFWSWLTFVSDPLNISNMQRFFSNARPYFPSFTISA